MSDIKSKPIRNVAEWSSHVRWNNEASDYLRPPADADPDAVYCVCGSCKGKSEMGRVVSFDISLVDVVESDESRATSLLLVVSPAENANDR